MSATCPLCKRPAATEFRPFCSKRCRDRDLISWLSEDYRIHGPAAPDAPGLDKTDPE